eukprot:11028123-Lingulodinium_polyedra.AAC.1
MESTVVETVAGPKTGSIAKLIVNTTTETAVESTATPAADFNLKSPQLKSRMESRTLSTMESIVGSTT